MYFVTNSSSIAAAITMETQGEFKAQITTDNGVSAENLILSDKIPLTRWISRLRNRKVCPVLVPDWLITSQVT